MNKKQNTIPKKQKRRKKEKTERNHTWLYRTKHMQIGVNILVDAM